MENIMNKILSLICIILIQFSLSNNIIAGDFEWLDNLNVRAEADSSGFRLSLSTRFHLGDVEVTAVLNQVAHPSDAYMIFRLGELSHRPLHDVINVYHSHKHQGWGKLAKSLGIKPGSSEFHALKRGHDLYSDSHHKSAKSSKKAEKKGKGKNNNKSKNKKNHN